jgi:hypothetical protein
MDTPNYQCRVSTYRRGMDYDVHQRNAAPSIGRAISRTHSLAGDRFCAVLKFPTKLRNFQNTSDGHGLLALAFTTLLPALYSDLHSFPRFSNITTVCYTEVDLA